MARPVRKRSPSVRAREEGYRSGLEDVVAAQLRAAGEPDSYESIVIRFTKPAKPSRYTPDFVLTNGVIVETKGRFVTADRQKHLAIKAAHPDLDIRFVFSNPAAKIGKKSKTTYAMWCDKYGFQYATKLVPQAWIDERVKSPRTVAIALATSS